MAIPTNTFQTYAAVGNREDLSDMIYNISPSDTPFQSLAGRGKATATFTEWQTDTLAAADVNNAVIEGDDASNDAVAPTVRVGNYLQTSDKVVVISTIQDSAVDKAGRKREMATQLLKRGKELKRDMETILLSNQARVVGNSTTAQKLRAMDGWYVTNVSRGATGVNGNATTAAVDGTQRNISEALVKQVMQTAYANGGQPTTLMVGPVNRVNVSSQLTGGATKFYRVEEKKLVATITVYETDFGPLKIVPNRFQRERDAHLLDPEFLAILYLEEPQSQDLAVTGLTRKKQMWATYTLQNKNEAAHGIVADITTTII